MSPLLHFHLLRLQSTSICPWVARGTPQHKGCDTDITCMHLGLLLVTSALWHFRNLFPCISLNMFSSILLHPALPVLLISYGVQPPNYKLFPRQVRAFFKVYHKHLQIFLLPSLLMIRSIPVVLASSTWKQLLYSTSSTTQIIVLNIKSVLNKWDYNLELIVPRINLPISDVYYQWLCFLSSHGISACPIK